MLPFCSIWLFTFSFVSNLSYNEYWHPPNLFANDFLVGLKCLDRSCMFLKETGLVQKQAGKISSRTSLKEQYMWICYQNNKLQHSKSWLIWTWFFSHYHFATNPTRWYDEWFSHGDLVDIGFLQTISSKQAFPLPRVDPVYVSLLISGLTAGIALDKVLSFSMYIIYHKHILPYFACAIIIF